MPADNNSINNKFEFRVQCAKIKNNASTHSVCLRTKREKRVAHLCLFIKSVVILLNAYFVFTGKISNPSMLMQKKVEGAKMSNIHSNFPLTHH